jgi:hypothetical protein
MINRGIKYKKIKKYSVESSSRFHKNDRVVIIDGEYKNQLGTIKEIESFRLALIELDEDIHNKQTGDLNHTIWVPFEEIDSIQNRRDDVIRNILDDYES